MGGVDSMRTENIINYQEVENFEGDDLKDDGYFTVSNL